MVTVNAIAIDSGRIIQVGNSGIVGDSCGFSVGCVECVIDAVGVVVVVIVIVGVGVVVDEGVIVGSGVGVIVEVDVGVEVVEALAVALGD